MKFYVKVAKGSYLYGHITLTFSDAKNTSYPLRSLFQATFQTKQQLIRIKAFTKLHLKSNLKGNHSVSQFQNIFITFVNVEKMKQKYDNTYFEYNDIS